MPKNSNKKSSPEPEGFGPPTKVSGGELLEQGELSAHDCNCGYAEGKAGWHAPDCSIFSKPFVAREKKILPKDFGKVRANNDEPLPARDRGEITFGEAQLLQKENKKIGYFIDYNDFTLKQHINILKDETRIIAHIISAPLPEKEESWEINELKRRHKREIISFIRKCPVESEICSTCENLVETFIQNAQSQARSATLLEVMGMVEGEKKVANPNVTIPQDVVMNMLGWNAALDKILSSLQGLLSGKEGKK